MPRHPRSAGPSRLVRFTPARCSLTGHGLVARGREDPAVDRDDGAREVSARPAGQEHGDTRHVIVAPDPPQWCRRGDRVAELVEGGSHHRRRERSAAPPR